MLNNDDDGEDLVSRHVFFTFSYLEIYSKVTSLRFLQCHRY